MISINDEIIIVSDIHIKDEFDQKYRLLLKLVEACIKHKKAKDFAPKQFILLGDIFDFFFGANPYFAKKYEELGRLLEELSSKECEVIFLKGNHEFALNKTPWAIEFSEEVYFQKNLANDKKLLFCHGDLIKPVWHYRWFSKLINSSLIHYICKLIPGALFHQICLIIASTSRQKNRYKNLNTKKLYEKIIAFLPSETTIAVIGHYHLNSSFMDQGKKVIFMPCWDEVPNFLGINSNGECVRNFINEDEAFKSELVSSMVLKEEG